MVLSSSSSRNVIICIFHFWETLTCPTLPSCGIGMVALRSFVISMSLTKFVHSRVLGGYYLNLGSGDKDNFGSREHRAKF